MTRLRLAQGTKRKAESLEAEAEQQEAPGMLRQFRASSVCGLPSLAVAPERPSSVPLLSPDCLQGQGSEH